jgi:hypothetical protein
MYCIAAWPKPGRPSPLDSWRMIALVGALPGLDATALHRDDRGGRLSILCGALGRGYASSQSRQRRPAGLARSTSRGQACVHQFLNQSGRGDATGTSCEHRFGQRSASFAPLVISGTRLNGTMVRKMRPSALYLAISVGAWVCPAKRKSLPVFVLSALCIVGAAYSLHMFSRSGVPDALRHLFGLGAIVTMAVSVMAAGVFWLAPWRKKSLPRVAPLHEGE